MTQYASRITQYDKIGFVFSNHVQPNMPESVIWHPFILFTQTDRLTVSFPRKRESRILSRFWIPVFTGMTGCFIFLSKKHLHRSLAQNRSV